MWGFSQQDLLLPALIAVAWWVACIWSDSKQADGYQKQLARRVADLERQIQVLREQAESREKSVKGA